MPRGHRCRPLSSMRTAVTRRSHKHQRYRRQVKKAKRVIGSQLDLNAPDPPNEHRQLTRGVSPLMEKGSDKLTDYSWRRDKFMLTSRAVLRPHAPRHTAPHTRARSSNSKTAYLCAQRCRGVARTHTHTREVHPADCFHRRRTYRMAGGARAGKGQTHIWRALQQRGGEQRAQTQICERGFGRSKHRGRSQRDEQGPHPAHHECNIMWRLHSITLPRPGWQPTQLGRAS